MSPLSKKKKHRHFGMLKVSQLNHCKNVLLHGNLFGTNIAVEYCKNMDQKLLQYHMQYLRTKVLQHV